MTNDQILEAMRKCNIFHIEDTYFIDFCNRFANEIAAMQREIDAELVEDFVCEHSHYRAGQRIREQRDE